MNQEMKLAVLIDAENISSKYIDVILSEANNLGDVVYKRIYGNWTTPQMASWRNTILDNAIQPIQQYDPQKFIGLGPHHRRHGFIVQEQSRRILHRIVRQ